LSKTSENCYGVSLYVLEIYQSIMKNSGTFFKKIGILHRLWASNRRNRVDTTSVGSPQPT